MVDISVKKNNKYNKYYPLWKILKKISINQMWKIYWRRKKYPRNG